MSFVSKDVVILPESTTECSDRWIAMNIFAKKSLGISSKVLGILGGIETEAGDEASSEIYRCWEIEFFSNEEGLLADPSRFRRDPRDWIELSLDRDALEAKLKEHCIVIDDEQAYLSRFKPKRNLLDYEQFGNFHQQHGQHMRVSKRVNPDEWWIKQKFANEGVQVRKDNLYGAVQWNFLESYFAQVIFPEMNTLDIGCGTGVYTNLMARLGAEATGVDPSEKYLKIAVKNAEGNATFVNAEVGSIGGLDIIPSNSADLVFISDSLLFYFVPMHSEQQADIRLLLSDVHRILKSNGTFVCMEPHSTFFLSPWLGNTHRPFTIVHEHMHRNFGVVPPLSRLIHTMSENGFVIRDYQEIGPEESFCDKDPRAYHFAREFPLWQLLEMRKNQP